MNIVFGRDVIDDLVPHIVAFMKETNDEWPFLVDIVRALEKHISPERAVRFYLGTNSKPAKDKPVDEKIRGGRRRGGYLAIQKMIKNKMVECKDSTIRPPDQRRYRLISEVPVLKKKRKPKPESKPVIEPDPEPKQEPVQELDPVLTADDKLVDIEVEFRKACKNHDDISDFQFHCRAMKRLMNEWIPKKG